MQDKSQLGTALVLMGVAITAGLGGYIASAPFRRARFMALLENPSSLLHASPTLLIGASAGVLLLIIGIAFLVANKRDEGSV